MEKYILVTGQASGIGHYAATQFHKAGFKVIGIDHAISEELDESIVQISCDLSKWSEAEAAFSKIERIDYAVNCAGVAGIRKRLSDITTEEITQSYNQIFLPTFHACKLEVAKMLGNCEVAKIINIASSTAFVGGKNMVAYSSAKAAIVNLTKVCAVECAPNIQVNSISPATIDTPMIRNKYAGSLPDYSEAYLTGRCGTVKDVWSAINFLLQNDFMTGSDIVMDGGYSSLFSLKLNQRE
ncbi:SDR family NAD(P)-dependent oxidoreductase [Cedecea sp. NFIX57]|uniref:SDR family NAD(P)-dependent oxidoreductase n=1 Tax=Cedecea sp. NFIX57 TaxID=1566286 RepID=UPI000A1C98D6|nr:SDR family oxidoreductase [Cedecea sp. NFIX57]